MAAVQSASIPEVSCPGGLAQWRNLAMSPRAPYMNSGVLAIDSNAWKARGLGREVLDFVPAHQDDISLADQDGFNGVLAGDWAALPLRWNQESCLWNSPHFAYSFFVQDEVDEALRDPAIIHFAGPPKTWHVHCEDPAAAQWRDVLDRTEFRNHKLTRPPEVRRLAAAQQVKRLLRL
jgi:lipopolysaccharide biosynthesis glycosyltransferase